MKLFVNKICLLTTRQRWGWWVTKAWRGCGKGTAAVRSWSQGIRSRLSDWAAAHHQTGGRRRRRCRRRGCRTCCSGAWSAPPSAVAGTGCSTPSLNTLTWTHTHIFIWDCFLIFYPHILTHVKTDLKLCQIWIFADKIDIRKAVKTIFTLLIVNSTVIDSVNDYNH